MSKLKNNKAVAEMLQGNHKTQTRKTIGFSDARDTAIIRKVGDVWEDKDRYGNVVWYEQMDGFRVSSNMHPDIVKELQKIRDNLRTFPNCRKDVCTCIKPTTLDEKFRKMVGMCEDCLISYETHLKITGQFNQYAMEKMRNNAESFFKQADIEVQVLKDAVDNITFAGDEHDVNPNEKWSFQDPESYKKLIDEKYNEFKENTLKKFEM